MTMTRVRELPKAKHTPFKYLHRRMMPQQLDRQRKFSGGDNIARFTSSARMSGGSK